MIALNAILEEAHNHVAEATGQIDRLICDPAIPMRHAATLTDALGHLRAASAKLVRAADDLRAAKIELYMIDLPVVAELPEASQTK